jgi:hypothetical protein
LNMKNTMQVLLLMMLITGTLFTACGSKEEVVEDNNDELIEEEAEEEGEVQEDVEELEEEVEEATQVRGIAEDPVEEEEVSDAPPTVSITLPPAEEEPEASVYADGSYTQSASYQSPAGAESLSVTLTLEDDEISAVSIGVNGISDVSEGYQNLFAGEIGNIVVGKNLEELDAVGAVMGSSLSPGGFNQAVAAIKTAAKN